MIKAMRFFEREERVNVLTMVLGSIAMYLYFWILFPQDSIVGGNLHNMYSAFLMMIGAIVMLSDVIQSYSRRYGLMISGGILRKHVFASQVVTQILFALFNTLVITVVYLVVGTPVTPGKIITILGLLLTARGMGNLLAVVTDRFGRPAYIVFILICGVLGGMMGGFSAAGELKWVMHFEAIYLFPIGIAVLAISCILLHKSIMNLEVRS